MDVQFLTGIKYRSFPYAGKSWTSFLDDFHDSYPQKTNITTSQIPKEYWNDHYLSVHDNVPLVPVESE